MIRIVDPVALGRPSFLDGRRCLDVDLLDADVAVLGVPYTTPTDHESSRSPSSLAPAAIREQSLRWAGLVDAYDFDFGADLFAGRLVRFADMGDMAGRPGQYRANAVAVSELIRGILGRGALPIILGGDPAVTLPAVRAYAGMDEVCVVRLAPELGWRDDVNGIREGAPSAMRRVAELPWVTATVHVGLRGPGSASSEDVAAAREFGAVLVRADDVHRHGAKAVLDQLPAPRACYVSIDAAALDPAIAPGVDLPRFGGLTYFEAAEILRGIAARRQIIGIDLLGIVPARDTNNMTSLLGARLVLDLLGAMAHRGELGRDGSTVQSATTATAATPVTPDPALVGMNRPGVS